MFETLIAIIVVIIGVIGFMQLLQVSLKNTDSASYRNRASILITDMFDHLRENGEDALDGTYNLGHPDATSGGPSALQGWRDEIGRVLPAGSGSVACVEADKSCTVAVRWNDSRGTGGDDTQTLSMRSLVQ